MTDILIGMARRWRKERVAAVLALATISLGVLGTAATHLTSLHLFNEPFGLLANRTTFPAVFSGGLLFVAGLTALAIAGRCTNAGWRWRILGGLLMVVGIEEAAALHGAVQQWVDAGWELVWAPIALTAAVLGTAVSWRLRPDAASRLLPACWAGWLSAQWLKGVSLDMGWIAAASAETLEMGAAAGFAYAFVAVLQELPASRENQLPREARGAVAVAVEVVRRIDVRRAGFVLAGAILVVVGAGTVVLAADIPLYSLSPRGERNVVSYVGATLLLLATALAMLSLETSHSRCRAWQAIAAFLAFMTVDELFGLHEKFDVYLGVPGQTIYLPLLLPAAIGGIVILRAAWWNRGARLLLIGGMLAWIASQGVDLRSEAFGYSALLEELLELTGTALLALGLLTELQARLELPDETHAGVVPAVGALVA